MPESEKVQLPWPTDLFKLDGLYNHNLVLPIAILVVVMHAALQVSSVILLEMLNLLHAVQHVSFYVHILTVLTCSDLN